MVDVVGVVIAGRCEEVVTVMWLMSAGGVAAMIVFMVGVLFLIRRETSGGDQ